jgi:hypothetical protein
LGAPIGNCDILLRTVPVTGLWAGFSRPQRPSRKERPVDPADRLDPDIRLRELLRGDPPAGVLALPAADRAELADLLADARRRQERTLGDAFTATLKHVPFPVRGIVKRVLLG